MKHLRYTCVLVLLLLTACAAFDSNVYPPLTARADVQDDPAQHTLTFELSADAPLARAQLLIGTGGAREPIDVPVDRQPLSYTLQVSEDGLRLPRGMDVLRYAWVVRSVYGSSLVVSLSATSPQLVRDDSAPVLDWKEARSGNISLRYLPNTAAERDLNAVEQISADAVMRSSVALDWPLSRTITVYLVPRIFWQGGATFDRTIFISYADRDFTGVSLRDYLAHEGAHALTSDWGNLGAAGGMLAEGLAVYATGGHYQPDVLDQSAATLVQSSLFIPPSILRRDFANQQHEIAYSESGSFVRYLVDRYGLDKVRALVRRPSDWSTLFGKDVDALTQDWLSYLRTLPTTGDDLQRWQLKVRFYNLLRVYEERFDADARRLPAPDVSKWDAPLREAMAAPGESEDNQVLELMLLSAIEGIEGTRSAQQLENGESYLADVERKVQTPSAPDDGLMAEVRSIVRLGESEDRALLDRNWDDLQSDLDGSGAPAFSAQFMQQAQAQPAWLRFSQTPVHLSLAGDQAWLTVAQWGEPLDGTQSVSDNGQRWVLALTKQGDQWRVAGRFPESPGALTAR